MKPALLSIAFCLGLYGATAQSSLPNQIRKVNPPAVALQPLHFLAADELMGRDLWQLLDDDLRKGQELAFLPYRDCSYRIVITLRQRKQIP